MESGLRTLDTPADAGGLIVMVRRDPADAARSIANDLRAELAVGGPETERALARRAARELESRDLDGLTQAMRRAELVRDRTRSLVGSKLSRSLNTKVAIHPDTLHRAAAEVLAMERAVAAAVESDRRAARRSRRTTVGALGLGGIANALLVAVGHPIVAAATVGAALSVAATAWWTQRRRPTDRHAPLEAQRDLAQKRWHQVAGVGADPTDVDAVVHRYDPQDPVVADLVSHHPAVRAAERMAVARRMAWVAAWRREVGDHGPVTDPVVADLLQRDRAELWLTTGTALARDEADTLVVAAPYADLPPERARALHRRLLGLHRTQRVIVVLPPEGDEAWVS